MKLRIAAASAAASIACGHAAVTTAPVHAACDRSTIPALFERGENEIVRDLAAIDLRFAKRAHVTPAEEDLRRVTMAALLHEDPSLAVIDGAIDPFSFDARARGLDAVEKRLETLPPGGGVERELLGRVVDGEVSRLDEERLLPRSASALVHAVVDDWTPPKDEREAADDDRWLARRLVEVRTAIQSSVDPRASLDVVRARELDDALDAFERITTGLVKTTQELVQVRAALESLGSRPAAKAHSDWDVVASRLRAQVGVTEDADALAADFAALEANLRARAEPAIAAAKMDRWAVSHGVNEHLFATGPCVDAVPASRLRSMAAPAEREPACQLRKILASDSAPDEPTALAILHDHVVVAAWALEVARGQSTIDVAEARHHLIVPPLFDTRARLERIALARPAAAIAAGLAVKILTEGAPNQRAKAWQRIGDVPLDLAAQELSQKN